ALGGVAARPPAGGAIAGARRSASRGSTSSRRPMTGSTATRPGRGSSTNRREHASGPTPHTSRGARVRPAPIGASGLGRRRVPSGTRRVDLVLPGSVPVAELVPELARSVGLLDTLTVYGGYRLVTEDGRPLATDAGLTIQGVEDGGVI